MIGTMIAAAGLLAGAANAEAFRTEIVWIGDGEVLGTYEIGTRPGETGRLLGSLGAPYEIALRVDERDTTGAPLAVQVKLSSGEPGGGVADATLFVVPGETGSVTFAADGWGLRTDDGSLGETTLQVTVAP